MHYYCDSLQMPPRQQGSSSKKRARPGTSTSRSGPSRVQGSYPPGLLNNHKDIYDLVMKQKEIKPNTVLNWDILRHYGFESAMNDLLQDKAWQNLHQIEEDIYTNITKEFIATFQIRYHLVYSMENFVSFHFNGQHYDLSIKEFIRLLGVYDDDFLNSPEIWDLKSDWYDDMSPTQFW